MTHFVIFSTTHSKTAKSEMFTNFNAGSSCVRHEVSVFKFQMINCLFYVLGKRQAENDAILYSNQWLSWETIIVSLLANSKPHKCISLLSSVVLCLMELSFGLACFKICDSMAKWKSFILQMSKIQQLSKLVTFSLYFKRQKSISCSS